MVTADEPPITKPCTEVPQATFSSSGGLAIGMQEQIQENLEEMVEANNQTVVSIR